MAESQTTLAPCPVCSEAPWHLGDRTHLRRGTARGWGFPFLAARLAGTGHTAGQRPAPLRGHGAGSKPGRCLPGGSGLAPRFPSLTELFARLFTWGCLLWRCPLWPARAIAATPGTARTQQPGRATPRQSGRTVRHRPGRAALAERSLPQGTAHPRAGCGAAWAAAGTRIAGSRTTESNFVPCWAACRVAAHGSWVRRGRREKGRKKHLFSLTVLGAQREGEEGLDKDLILDCLISVRLLLNQRLPRYSLSWVPPSTQLPRGGQGGERAQLGQHRRGTLGNTNCQLRAGRGAATRISSS